MDIFPSPCRSRTPHAVVIANSTFVNGTCQGNTGGARGARGCGLGVGLGATARSDIANTLFDNNAISDVTIEGASLAYYDHSRVPVSNGPLSPTVNHPLSGDPRFVDTAGLDFRLFGNAFQ